MDVIWEYLLTGWLQGIELQLATNCLGPFLFTQLLLPILQRTAAAEPACPVRVTWAASFAVEINGPEGILMQEDGTPDVCRTGYMKYYSSKVGNLFYSKEFARHYGQDGIVSVVSTFSTARSEKCC
jgi:NAD(P)-dependent dehydrogenase (short-subunit alcohol dehydrogenase family)